MNRRFYVPNLAADVEIELTNDEAHHLLHVLRAEVGTTVQLFDGKGFEGEAVVRAAGKRTATLGVGELRSVSREPSCDLVLATALPKSGRERFMIEKAVELGVAELVVFSAVRSVVRPSARFIQRAERAVIEASKQCGRNRLMPVRCDSLASIVSDACFTNRTRWIAHPAGRPFCVPAEGASHIAALIGPEGGFTDEEIDLARSHGWEPVSLGSRILRIETAALALAARLLLGE